MLHGHQYGALVDIEPHTVGVTAVIDKGKGGVDGSPEPVQGEVVPESLDLVGVVDGGADDLVDQAKEEGLHVGHILPGFEICWNEISLFSF